METGTDRFYIDLFGLPFPSIMGEMAKNFLPTAGVAVPLVIALD
jgi:hypothetical protein